MRELLMLARELYRRPEIDEVTANFTSARVTVVLSSDYVEKLLKAAIHEAKSFYGRFGLLKEMSESEFEDGTFEMTLSIERGRLDDLESAVGERGDEITSMGLIEGDLRVKILLRSSSVERVVEPLVEELKNLGFMVEYAGTELEASKIAIFSPPTSSMRSGGMATSISTPMKYRVYLNLCMRLRGYKNHQSTSLGGKV